MMQAAVNSLTMNGCKSYGKNAKSAQFAIGPIFLLNYFNYFSSSSSSVITCGAPQGVATTLTGVRRVLPTSSVSR